MREEIIKIIERVCNEQTMPRVWDLNKEQIDEIIKTLPVYEPKEGEEYQVGFARGETWGALKIKLKLLGEIGKIKK